MELNSTPTPIPAPIPTTQATTTRPDARLRPTGYDAPGHDHLPPPATPHTLCRCGGTGFIIEEDESGRYSQIATPCWMCDAGREPTHGTERRGKELDPDDIMFTRTSNHHQTHCVACDWSSPGLYDRRTAQQAWEEHVCYGWGDESRGDESRGGKGERGEP